MEREPRRRRRPALSCLECRRRKIKCDRNEPCAQCVSTRAQCSYKRFNDEPAIQQPPQPGISGVSTSSPSANAHSPLAPVQRIGTNRSVAESDSRLPRPWTSAAATGKSDASNTFGRDNVGPVHHDRDTESTTRDLLDRIRNPDHSSVSSGIDRFFGTADDVAEPSTEIKDWRTVLNKTRTLGWSRWLGLAHEVHLTSIRA